jgi:hypothetical protein
MGRINTMSKTLDSQMINRIRKADPAELERLQRIYAGDPQTLAKIARVKREHARSEHQELSDYKS